MPRTGIATVLVLLGCLLAGPAVAAYGLNHQISDQNRYAQAAAVVLDNPAVRAELANRVSESVNAKLPEATHRVVSSGVTKAVDSEKFRTAWVAVNARAQPEVIAMLRGDPSTLRIVDDTVVLDLGEVWDQVKAKLVADHVPLANQLPGVDISIKLFSRPAIRQAIPAFGLFQDLSVVLPLAALALIVLGLVITARRGRTVLITGAGLVVAMLLLVLYQWIGRGQLVDKSQSPQLAGAFYDALASEVVLLQWIVLGVGVLAAIIGLVLPKSPPRSAFPSGRPA